MARLRVPSANQSAVATPSTETRAPRSQKSSQKPALSTRSTSTHEQDEPAPMPKTSKRELRYMDTSFQDSENTPFKPKAPSPVKPLSPRKQRVLGPIGSNSRLLRKLSDETLASPEKKDKRERRVRSGTADVDVVKKQRLMYAKSLAKSVAGRRANKGRIDVVGLPEVRREEQVEVRDVQEEDGDVDMDVDVDVDGEAETSLWCGDEQDVEPELAQNQEVEERTEAEEEDEEEDDDDEPVVFVRQRQRQVRSRAVQSDTEDEEEDQLEEAKRRTHLPSPESMDHEAAQEPVVEEPKPLVSMRPPFKKGHSTISNWAQEVIDLTNSPEPPASFILPPPNRARTASFAASSRPTSSDSNAAMAVLTYSPTPTKQRSPCKAPPLVRPITPPALPASPSKLVSPSKKKPLVPKAPDLRPSLDTFWNPEVVNDWNDRHAPSKPLVSPKKQKWREDIVKMMEGVNLEDNNSSSGEDIKPPTTSPKKKQDPKRTTTTTTTTNPPKKSPTEPSTKELRAQRKDFATRKHDLATTFLTTLDTTISSGRIAALSHSTGGIKLLWSKTLKTTAGRANWRREQLRIRCGPHPNDFRVEIRHHCSIELAEKVIDDEERLYNVLAHEFCHLTTFMISDVRNNPHGAEFKSWGRRATAAFADRGVEVTTKHAYQIEYKYIWECVACGYEFKRHSKSVDPGRHSCGRCKGGLVQTKPTPRATGEGKGGKSEYQVFVKEHFADVKRGLEGRGLDAQMGRVMEEVARQYREMKAESARVVGEEAGGGGLEEALGGLRI
ncbi:hypothetical protein P153DRAFT_422745 [Dothidotthia symphoricarpi CBS 119687]|uniref:SprT-like domain-containing protein n=1 Tax=Dothidotthia symphoricarpi CBS 119687 TaxID=1392245 RepID=A0A6A6ADT9_9PLEO|nr:uncharacterized protein P153DRAFT_422745 [Dothidotthia symphoricarpi CBS 119687]KAF2130009.1 hypothetical protein P153DRAFT_422745 [Dothidotthia symphoricarpi CBS 119687]